jgi:hypothetical protein
MISARPPGEEVDRRELLEHADRIVRAQNGDGARQADAGRADRRSREHDRRGRDGEVRPVMLADAEHLEADLVRERGLLHEIAHALSRVDAAAQLGERVDADLH